MSFFDTMILYVILILFSMGLALTLKVYNKSISRIKDDYLIDIATFLMMYLFIKYCNYESVYGIILINIPFVISIIHKRKLASILLAIIIISFYYALGYSLSILIIEYMFYILMFIIMNKKRISLNNILLIFICTKGISLTIENFYILNNNSLYAIVKIYLSLVVFYLLGVAIIKIISIMENAMDLNKALTELEKEKELKNSLFKITHELKNPIAVCKGYLEMINIDNKDKANKYLNIIKQEIDRSLNIMSDFMEFSKIKVDKELLDINILLEDITEELKILLKNKNIKLKTIITKDEIYIEGDYNRLKQVFINIVKNSIESIKNKGEINIITHILKKNYYIEITDNGCGMDEQTLKKVKELFYTTKKNGTGLGVSLSEEIIKAHNGSMEYKSKKDKGTKVIVKLPITMI